MKDSSVPREMNSPMNASALRVMSFNIRYGTADDGLNNWEHRRELVVDTIEQFNPDLLATQEGLAFQIEYLRERLPQLNCLGVGREDGKQRGEYVAVLYRAARFARLDEGHFWLSETLDVPGSKSWQSSQTRMVTWCRLSEKTQPESTFYLFNTHFDQRSETARQASAELLRRQVLTLSDGEAAVVVGDFNCSEDELPYETLVSGSDNEPRLIDAYRSLHHERQSDELTRHGFGGARTGSRIDWILHSRHFRTQEAAIERIAFQNRFPSDHYPVTAILSRTCWT